jgi:hypothetical protein
MLNGMGRPTHVLTSPRYKELEFWTVIYTITDAHLVLSQGDFEHEPPEGASAAFQYDVSYISSSCDASPLTLFHRYKPIFHVRVQPPFVLVDLAYEYRSGNVE